MDTPVGINFSGGTSSLWAIKAIIHGEIPRPTNVAVFTADTGDEHEWTYETIDRTEEECREHGIPFIRCAADEPLFDAVMSAARGERTRVDNPPFWTENQGGAEGNYIKNARRSTRRDRSGARNRHGWDRSGSASRFRVGWGSLRTNNIARTIRLGRSRAAQRADIERWTGKPAPRFSMCRRCPYKNPERWRQTSESDQRIACETDEAIRDGLASVDVLEPAFITDRLIPLEHLIRRGDPQPNLPGFEPGCNSGYCFL